MRPIDRGEILGLADYEAVRDRFRTRVIASKKSRRVAIGDKASAVFENRDTVLLQIQEMLRTERITRSGAIQHEIDTYSELLPGDDELSCTLMIEIAEATEREKFLHAATGLERHVWFVAGEQSVPARSIDRFASDATNRTTAVHYLKFALPVDVAGALRARAAPKGSDGRAIARLALKIDHPAYVAFAPLAADTVIALGEDLQG